MGIQTVAFKLCRRRLHNFLIRRSSYQRVWFCACCSCSFCLFSSSFFQSIPRICSTVCFAIRYSCISFNSRSSHTAKLIILCIQPTPLHSSQCTKSCIRTVFWILSGKIINLCFSIFYQNICMMAIYCQNISLNYRFWYSPGVQFMYLLNVLLK